MPGPASPRPAKTKQSQPAPQKAGSPADTGPPDRQREMMSELEDSLMKGLISRKAYDKAKKLIKEGKK